MPSISLYGTSATMELVMTTRRTVPTMLAASRRLRVPDTAGRMKNSSCRSAGTLSPVARGDAMWMMCVTPSTAWSYAPGVLISGTMVKVSRDPGFNALICGRDRTAAIFASDRTAARTW
jgi:hypothetical protein